MEIQISSDIQSVKRQDKNRLNKISTNPVFLSMGRVSNKMSNLRAEVFPDGPTHVMNKIHQVFLLVKKKTKQLNKIKIQSTSSMSESESGFCFGNNFFFPDSSLITLQNQKLLCSLIKTIQYCIVITKLCILQKDILDIINSCTELLWDKKHNDN